MFIIDIVQLLQSGGSTQGIPPRMGDNIGLWRCNGNENGDHYLGFGV